MSQVKRDYAIKALNLMGCLFVKTFNESKALKSGYDEKEHLKLYLKTFAEIGFAGSKMDDLMPFYEVLSFTVNKDKTLQQYISKKLSSYKDGLENFVDDSLLTKVPINQLEKHISELCQSNSLSSLLSTKITIVVTPTQIAISKVEILPWYQRYDIIFILLITILCALLGIYVIYLFRASTATYTSQFGGKIKGPKRKIQ
jgi:hypothetical protein